MEDVYVLRMVIDFEVDGQSKKGGPKSAWKKQVFSPPIKVHCWCCSKYHLVEVNLATIPHLDTS